MERVKSKSLKNEQKLHGSKMKKEIKVVDKGEREEGRRRRRRGK